MSSRLDQQTAEFRALRREIEESILPLATSVDGRRFELQASLHGLELQVGGVRRARERRRTSARPGRGARARSSRWFRDDERRRVRWSCERGWCSARSAARASSSTATASRSTMRSRVPAEPAEVAEWLATIRPARATLTIGELLLAPGVPATLDAGGFDRHTFLCGQSGSGKTYSLGLVLERLLVETDLRLIILDPNSDYVRLGEQRADGRRGARRGLRRRRERRRRAARRRGSSPPTRPARPKRPRGRACARSGGRSRGVRARRPVARRRHHLRRAGDVGRAARAGASAPSGEPRRAEAGSCGRAAGRGRSSTTSSGATRAVSSSTSAHCRRARSRPSPRRPCSQRSGGAAPTASPCSS